MKMKVLYFLISLFIVTFSSTAWRDVGHGVVASIALKNLTPKTKTEVEALLSKQIANPGYIKCNSANSQYNMVAIASWADLAKRGKWDEGKEFSKFYNGCHIISCSKKITNNDVLMTENMAEDLINFAVVDSEGSNVLTGINSSIKTLELSQSPEQKAFALRLLVHYSGDAACPIHTADPIYYYYKGDEYEGFNTTGGNAFVFREPYFFKNIDGSNHKILNLHKFWDGMGGAYNQIAPYEGKIELTAEQIKYYNEISDELIEKYKNRHDEINNNPDFKKLVIHSVVEGHNTALPPRLFETSKYVKNNTWPYEQVLIDIPEEEYFNSTQRVSKEQIFRAGVMLGNILNAIFDPYNNKSQPAYVQYLDKIIQNNSLKELDALKNINVQFE